MEAKKDLTLIRKPEYLSPSQLKMYESDKEKYFMTYLAVDRPPRFPQTKPMAIGSGFDAFVKSDLSHRYLPEKDWYYPDKLFKDQVEKPMQDLVWDDTTECYKQYKEVGAYNGLLKILDKATEIQFETRITKVIEGVPIMGVPDMMCKTTIPIIFDWKVNGYYSQASPRAGYSFCYPDGSHHKDAVLVSHHNIMHNGAWFDDLYPDHAMQLATYAWLCGLPVGNDQFNMIHQLAWRNGKLRVAVLSGLCNQEYQVKLMDRYKRLWESIQTNTVFSPEETERYNRIALTQYGDTPEQDLFRELTRNTRNF